MRAPTTARLAYPLWVADLACYLCAPRPLGRSWVRFAKCRSASFFAHLSHRLRFHAYDRIEASFARFREPTWDALSASRTRSTRGCSTEGFEGPSRSVIRAEKCTSGRSADVEQNVQKFPAFIGSLAHAVALTGTIGKRIRTRALGAAGSTVSSRRFRTGDRTDRMRPRPDQRQNARRWRSARAERGRSPSRAEVASLDMASQPAHFRAWVHAIVAGDLGADRVSAFSTRLGEHDEWHAGASGPHASSLGQREYQPKR
jgi:hypothetical protein